MATTGDISAERLAVAQDAARAGRVEDATLTLEAAAEQGSASAAYSLAEIHALRGEWARALDRLAQFVPKEAEARAANVKRDAAGLLWRAAEETGRWTAAAALLAGLNEHAVGGLFHRSLTTLLTAGGQGDAPVLSGSSDTPEQRREKLARAHAKNDPFSIVMFAKEDVAFDADVLAHYAAAEPKMRFDYMLQALPAFIRAGRLDEAWSAFVAKMPAWANVEGCQIAPVVVVWSPALRPMMTPARSAALLGRNFS